MPSRDLTRQLLHQLFRRRVRRVILQSEPCVHERLGTLTTLQEHLAQGGMGIGVIGLAAQRRTEFFDGPCPVTVPKQAGAEVVMGVREIGLRLHGAAELCLPSILLALQR